MSVCGVLPKSVVKFRLPVLIAITKRGLSCGIAAARSRRVLRRCCLPPRRCRRFRNRNRASRFATTRSCARCCIRRPMSRLPRATSTSSAWTSRWRRRRAATSPWRSCCPIRLISRSSVRNRQSTFRTAIHPSRFRSSAGSRQPTASCWSGARRSTNLTGACSRARRSWASGPAARRCSFWRRRCVRTGSIRKRT